MDLAIQNLLGVGMAFEFNQVIMDQFMDQALDYFGIGNEERISLQDRAEAESKLTSEDKICLAKAKAARSVALNLKPLQQLCKETLLRNTNRNHNFGILPAAVLDSFIMMLLAELKDPKYQIRISRSFVLSLLNPNLRTYDWRLLGSKIPDIWEMLKGRCGQLTTIVYDRVKSKGSLCCPKPATPSHLLKDFGSFPNLQYLNVYNHVLGCEQIELLPEILPRLRFLELTVETLEPCCQQRLCMLTKLEQLAVGRRNGAPAQFFDSLWVTCLSALPNLRVVSKLPLKDRIDPCLADALAMLQWKRHETPLQLRRLCLTSRGMSGIGQRLPLHLLGSVTSLSLFSFPKDRTEMLLQALGPNLTELRVESEDEEFDFYLLLSLCPKLELLHLDLNITADNPRGVTLPRGHFGRLRELNLHVTGATVPAGVLQLALEAPNLKHFNMGQSTCELSEALMKTITSRDLEGLLKNMHTFSTCLDINDSNAASLVVGLKALIVAAPRLQYLRLVVTDTTRSKLLADQKFLDFCKHVPRLNSVTVLVC